MRRIAFLLVWLIELLLVTTGVALLAAWIWSGTDGSLATAIRQAQAYLPAGQTIETGNVSGAIRSSGRIGSLRWQADGLSVHARDLRFSWQPLDLLQRRLHFGSLAIAEVEIDDQRPATEPQTPQPPPEVLLPIALNLPFSVDRLRLRGATALEVTDIAGRYQFSDRRHQLQLDSIAVAQGQYSGHLSLQAQAPMTLDLQLHGTVTAPVAQDKSIKLEASATLRGPLAGTNASLDLLAQLQPAPGAGGALAQARAMRASVSAQISPWAAQPLTRAQASFNQLNLAALLPSAPRTLLTGNAWVRPVGSNWLVDFNLINRDAGPWDKGQLPLDSAKGLVQLAGKRWNIETLHAEAAGGRIRLQGALADPSTASATSGWQGQVQIQGVDPARLHTQMESVQLDGELSARARNDGVDFDATLQPALKQAQASALRGVRLRDAAASGRWADGWLRVDKLRIRTADASVDGRVDVELASKTARPQLRLVAPGLLADLSGQFGALDGNGDLALTLSDAAETRAWLARLPQMPDIVDAFDLQGNADLTLKWTGGWEALQQGGRGASPSLEARLQVPRLAIRERKQAADTTLRVSALDVQVAGKLEALTVSLRGNAARANQRLQLETGATGGRDARGDWQATLRSLHLQAQDSALPGPWNLALAQPLTASFASATGELRVGAAQAQLTGPEPGVATLAWEPVRWQQRSGSTSLVSKGALRGLPMGWITLLANVDLHAAGLSGNLLFDGQWDITLADQLVARATLTRRSGDIRIQAEGAAPAGVGVTTSANATVNAGIRELQLQLRADGDTLKADFRWDSERAGNAQAALSTRLTRSNDGWPWSPDSPLEATVRANMPQVGVWSLLAPPGWRVRGTVDANLKLTGTLRTPQWSGSLLASEMAVRSVADGIEFGNGQLRASLQGQRLNIEAFSLQGAGGASGGELTASGFASWTPVTGAQASALDAIRLQIDARANALRVSARADRRLAVSGTLQALLDNAKLQIRGALSVDQALFILPDETAPSLGSDVVVLRKGQTRASDAAIPTPTTKVADTRPTSAPGSTLDADLLVTLDLGQDFQVRGRGIDTRVAGELTLRSKLKPGESPTVTGELRTVGGQFKAYGQQLEIERGVMRFGGAYNNPSLNILAVRPKLTQRVGVQITGSALLPRVRLYAEPDLPEAEKLAWLVLGRSGANGGAEAAVLQQAAMALLGGQNSSGGFAGRLGLDEISLGGATEGGATSATVTLGKRISQNFYVAYESSLAGALGTFSIFYDLSERFTLRASTGAKSAVDLIFKYSYD